MNLTLNCDPISVNGKLIVKAWVVNEDEDETVYYKTRLNLESEADRAAFAVGVEAALKGAGKPMALELDRVLREMRGHVAATTEAVARPNIVRLSDVQEEEVEWLWPGRIPLGMLSLGVGDPGVGKSTWSLDVAARTTTGKGFPDNPHLARDPGSVILLGVEDALAVTVVKRCRLAGANLSKIVALQGVRIERPDGSIKDIGFTLDRNLPILEDAIVQAGDTRLIIVDPLSAFVGEADSHKDSDVRSVLAPLTALAERHRVAVLGVMHMNKNGGANALYRTSGSLAFVAASRSAWLIAKDKDNPDRRFVAEMKNNVSESMPAMVFSIKDGAIEYEQGMVDATAASLLAADDDGEKGQLDEAMEWLRAELANGSKPQTTIIADARKNGHSEKTIRRAKKTVGVISRKDAFDGGWAWSLADRDPFQG